MFANLTHFTVLITELEQIHTKIYTCTNIHIVVKRGELQHVSLSFLQFPFFWVKFRGAKEMSLDVYQVYGNMRVSVGLSPRNYEDYPIISETMLKTSVK